MSENALAVEGAEVVLAGAAGSEEAAGASEVADASVVVSAPSRCDDRIMTRPSTRPPS